MATTHGHHTFYCDKNEIDENNILLDSWIASALLARGIKQNKSVGFDFNYNSLPMEKIMTQWIVIEKLLKSKKSDNITIGVSSVAISYACRKQTYSLDVSDSV